MSIVSEKHMISGAPRPPRAVVGSHREKEEIFGAVYDPATRQFEDFSFNGYA